MNSSYYRYSYLTKSSPKPFLSKDHHYPTHYDRYRSRSRYHNRTRYSSKYHESKHKKLKYSFSSSSSSSSSNSSSDSRSYSSSSDSSRHQSESDHSVKIITSGSTDQRRNASHYRFQRGQKIGHKYWIKDILGDGTFGRVLRGQYQNKNYAIKVIKPVQKYMKSAKIQRDIIKTINKQDPDQKYGIVKVIESFYHRNYFCIVFEQLGSSLYQLIKKNKYKGFPRTLVKKFFYQILKSLSFIHRLGYTHTDLKPENILLVKDDFEVRNEYRGVEKYFYPKNTNLKIIDFGSATKYDEHHSSIINTRQYRSPQVLLQCCKWNEISDVWSIGCIIVQLYTGNLLFDTHNDYQHLGMIVKNCGLLPRWMVRESRSELGDLFNEEGQIKERKLKKYLGQPINIIEMKTVDEIFDHDRPLRELLNQCLQLDPRKRISCDQAMRHRYFTNFTA